MSRRQGPDRRTGRQPSNRWRRASAALGKAQGRVADQRKDSLHKLTTRLAAEFGTVVVEDLNVAGMVRNRRLARHVADASFGEFRRQLEYKTAWHGGRVIVADRWFASSKTCSGCGAVKAKLRPVRADLRVHVVRAGPRPGPQRGTEPRRVRQSAIAGSGPETANGRGADRKTGPARQVAVKRQPGTARSGSDRDRPEATRDCEGEHSCSLTRNG